MAIFVSYSRRDDAFVRQLHERILARGRETWVDWEGIPPSADWMREIREAIDAAEAVVFVISSSRLAHGCRRTSTPATGSATSAASRFGRPAPTCRQANGSRWPLAVLCA